MIEKGLIQWKVLQTVKNLAKVSERADFAYPKNNSDYYFWINVLIEYGCVLNEIEKENDK